MYKNIYIYAFECVLVTECLLWSVYVCTVGAERSQNVKHEKIKKNIKRSIKFYIVPKKKLFISNGAAFNIGKN